MNRDLKWNLLILASVVDIFVGALAGLGMVLLVINSAFGNSGSTMINGNPANQQGITITSFMTAYPAPFAIILGIIVGVSIMMYPKLTVMRQEARDEAEYDENGISRKRGKFSQLSKEERAAIDRQKMIDRERILPSTQLKAITRPGPNDADAELNKLIALDNVKIEVQKMKARMEYESGKRKEEEAKEKKNKKRKKNTGEQPKMKNSTGTMNCIFKGSPGTAKTSVARILTGYFYEYGYIKKNQIIEVDGNFFNGLSTGESSKKANLLISAARGGVLFIDEAYSLLSTGGQEVIATLVKAMEDYRDDMIFIYAGYTNEMNALIDSNPGIKSRVKHEIVFNDYGQQEMEQIFSYMANEQDLYVPYDVLTKAVEYLLKEKQRDPKNFGNARSVRTLLDKMTDNHAFNLSQGKILEDERYRLSLWDLP